MAIVPESERTTAWYLFNRRFLCRIPAMANRTLEDVKEFGVFSTGDAVIDREMSKEPVHRYLTIAEMENIYHQGHRINVVNYAETKTIYELISNHLLAWRTFFETMENNRVPQETIDELIRLDGLAGAVYVSAKHLFNEQIAQSVFARFRQQRTLGAALTRGMFTERTEKPVDAPLEEGQSAHANKPDVRPERVSWASRFEAQKAVNNVGGRGNGGRSWN